LLEVEGARVPVPVAGNANDSKAPKAAGGSIEGTDRGPPSRPAEHPCFPHPDLNAAKILLVVIANFSEAHVHGSLKDERADRLMKVRR